MNSLLTRKLNYLCQVFGNPGIGEAWRFYQQNRDRFQHPIYVPFLDIVVHNQADLKYLNNSVSARDAFVFIFGCKEDEDLLMRGGNPYRINSSIIDRRMVSIRAPDHLICLHRYNRRLVLAREVPKSRDPAPGDEGTWVLQARVRVLRRFRRCLRLSLLGLQCQSLTIQYTVVMLFLFF